MTENLEYYKKLILDHNKVPRNYGVIDPVSHSQEGYNPLCGDRVSIFAHLEQQKVVNIAFESQACALCKASASMMTDIVKGEEIGSVQKIYEQFEGMLDAKATGEDLPGDLSVFASVSAYPSRVKCVKLPWTTLCEALQVQAESCDE